MPKYVAFLRAINVGGHTVKMDQLKSLFEALGFTNVETFIASGNVIFDAKGRDTATLERRIEKHLLNELGYDVATFVRATADLPDIASHEPFDQAEIAGATLYIGFLATQPTVGTTKRLLACATEVDLFHVEGREVYWLCRTKFSESQFSGARLEKTLDMQITLRNTNTVKKIAAKYQRKHLR